MSSYIISYDLVGQKDYKKLFNALYALGSVAHVHESVWVVSFNESEFGSKEIREKLSSFIDSDDRLFVAKLTGQAAWSGGSIDSTDQIKLALN